MRLEDIHYRRGNAFCTTLLLGLGVGTASIWTQPASAQPYTSTPGIGGITRSSRSNASLPGRIDHRNIAQNSGGPPSYIPDYILNDPRYSQYYRNRYGVRRPEEDRRKRNVWEAPTKSDNKIEQSIEQAQIDYGAKDIQVAKLMWRYAQQYFEAKSYTQALKMTARIREFVYPESELASQMPMREITKLELDARNKLKGSSGDLRTSSRRGVSSYSKSTAIVPARSHSNSSAARSPSYSNSTTATRKTPVSMDTFKRNAAPASSYSSPAKYGTNQSPYFRSSSSKRRSSNHSNRQTYYSPSSLPTSGTWAGVIDSRALQGSSKNWHSSFTLRTKGVWMPDSSTKNSNSTPNQTQPTATPKNESTNKSSAQTAPAPSEK